MGYLVGFIVFMGVCAVIGHLDKSTKQRQLVQAKHAYENSLAQLRSNPSDPNIHTRTLQLGRDYSKQTRENSAVTVYDEMAVLNDINASSAGGIAAARARDLPCPTRKQQTYTNVSALTRAPVPTASQSSMAIQERLKILDELKSKQLITETEYTSKRKDVLAMI